MKYSSSAGIYSGLRRNVGFVCVAAVLLYCVFHAFDPPRLNWGDSGSDYNVLIAGRNFQKYGFLKLRLTPYLLDPRVMTPADSSMIYTHYPQLPDLVNGVLRSLLRFSDLAQFRLVALLLSFGALFFVYQLAAFYWTRRVAQITLALWVLNALWIQHADYLHHGPYGAFFGFGSLYFLARSFGEVGRRYRVAAAAFVFMTFCSSYDYWVFVPPLIAMTVWHHHGQLFRRESVRTLALLATCATLAIVLKLATNAWALGGVRPFLHDVRFQYLERATDDVVHTAFTGGIWATLEGRVERYFSLLLFPLALFWLVAPLIRRRWPVLFASPHARVNPIVLLLAALPFLAVFREIWVAQYYPGLLVVPFYAVGFAVIIALMLDAPTRLGRLAGVALGAALIVNSLSETLAFKRAFFNPADIPTLRAQLDSLAPPGQEVLVDHVFDHFYRYYFDRNVVPMIVHPAYRMDDALSYFSDPSHPRFASATGAVFVQHKHLTDQMFDKGYYYILARYRLWRAWGNPPAYRSFVDSLIADRDSQLVLRVARRGVKVAETDSYVLWLLKPTHHDGLASR